jgi:hypothetical protein
MIVTIATAGGLAAYGRYIDRQTNLVTADQMGAVSDAAAGYIKDNYAAVAASATPTAPAVITTAMLRATGYLQAGFADKNAYGQDYRVLVLQPTPNKLQSLIVTVNGDTIKELHLIEIAKQQGGKGGYVPLSNTGIALGSFGGWQTALAPYGVSPGAGHLATALFFEDGALVNDYLYRHAVPGQPELQTMHAAINMNTNNLNNVGTVNAAAANISGNTRTTGETYTGGWFRSTGDTGWFNEKHIGGWYMSDPAWVRSYADKNVFTGGEMRAGKLTSTGRTEVGEFLQLNTVSTAGTGCSPNGMISRDAVGTPLTCQSGVWRMIGIMNVERVAQYYFITGLPLPRLVDVSAQCPAGKKVVSGGCNFNGYSLEVNLDDSSPSHTATAWNCSVRIGSIYQEDPWNGVEASAICASYGD